MVSADLLRFGRRSGRGGCCLLLGRDSDTAVMYVFGQFWWFGGRRFKYADYCGGVGISFDRRLARCVDQLVVTISSGIGVVGGCACIEWGTMGGRR